MGVFLVTIHGISLIMVCMEFLMCLSQIQQKGFHAKSIRIPSIYYVKSTKNKRNACRDHFYLPAQKSRLVPLLAEKSTRNEPGD